MLALRRSAAEEPRRRVSESEWNQSESGTVTYYGSMSRRTAAGGREYSPGEWAEEGLSRGRHPLGKVGKGEEDKEQR
jgi:hypothetical protein